MSTIKRKYKLPKGVEVKRSTAGLGLFATQSFAKDEFVIQYKGQKISHNTANGRGGLYLFTLNEKWVIDGKDRANIARYLNHSCYPTCEAIIEDDKRIVFHAIKKIKPGDELTFDYGEEYFDDIISKKGCRCIKCHKTKNTA